MAALKERGVVDAGAGQVRQQHAECDRQQEHRLKLLDNGQVKKNAVDRDHHEIQRIFAEKIETRALQKINNSIHGNSLLCRGYARRSD